MIYLLFQNTKGSGGTGGVETLLPLVCTICAALGCLLGFVMLENTDEAENKGPSLNAALQLDEEKNTKEPGLGLKAALKLITSPQSLLLCGVYLYNGLEQGFAWCNFTSGMVLPVYGNEAMIGILMMCYAATDALTGSLSSQLSSSGTMTRSLIFYAIVSQSVCVSVVNNFFNTLEAPLYVTAFVLGVGDALLNTKIGVLLGSDFKGKEHVVMVSLWRGITSLGCAIPFFLSTETGISFDVWLLTGVGAFAIVSFLGYWALINKKSESSYHPILGQHD
jgi:hypothetical protein